jgi:hypothetical protein
MSAFASMRGAYLLGLGHVGHLAEQRVALAQQLGHAVDQGLPFDTASVVTPYLEQVANLVIRVIRLPAFCSCRNIGWKSASLNLACLRIASAVASASSIKLAIRSASIQQTTRYTQLSAAPFKDFWR